MSRQQSEETTLLIKFRGNEHLRRDEFIQTLNAGPQKNRACTDLYCCIIFFLFMGGIVWQTHHAFQNGINQLFSYPFDSDCKSFRNSNS